MELDVEKYVSPRALEAVRRAGLHKVAAVIEGVDEITIKEAVSILGRKAYMRRKEAGQVAAGIAALAELRNEKVANWGPLLQRSFLPAVAGAGLAMVPDMMQEGPFDPDKAMQHALMGGALGGVGGAARSLQLAGRSNPMALQELLQSMPQMPPR